MLWRSFLRFLHSSERQEAAASLGNESDGPILAEWLLELEAAVAQPSSPGAVTLDQYRTYRRIRREEPSTLRAQIYRLLPP